jgi:hypothetical protein
VTLNIVDIPSNGGGWFKPADHTGTLAFLLEVKAFDRQRPTPNGPKDSALVDISAFTSQGELDNGTPQVTKGTRIEQTVLARDLEALVGSATIVKLDQVPSKRPGGHPAWVWRPVSGDVRAKVIAFAEKREAELQAAVDAAPGFDD